jgi:hypothetical protein
MHPSPLISVLQRSLGKDPLSLRSFLVQFLPEADHWSDRTAQLRRATVAAAMARRHPARSVLNRPPCNLWLRLDARVAVQDIKSQPLIR